MTATNAGITDDGWAEAPVTALLVLADGTVIEGYGLGAVGTAVGEVCFNTAMTGYQEILTDPSYAGQIITFTFPHIGNIGTNAEDVETVDMDNVVGARGCVLKDSITDPSNYRAMQHLDAWLKERGIVGISGVDTRALTALIREKGMPNAIVAHAPDGKFDVEALKGEAAGFPGLVGMDLVPMVTCAQMYEWSETPWVWGEGFGAQDAPDYHVVAIDYGVKRNILRLLAGSGCRVTVVPATTSADTIRNLSPDGIFLSNGPGDPAETGKYTPCPRSAPSSTAACRFRHLPWPPDAGARPRRHTAKMHQRHHGANHPVRTAPPARSRSSMNHGFAVDRDSLPAGVGRPCLAVRRLQLRHPPEGPAGLFRPVPSGSLARPRDSHYLFTRFINLIREQKGEAAAAER
ncbi:MAG: carbamoyl phosphate synthase small subunit [Hyphomicrobiales bacterium]